MLLFILVWLCQLSYNESEGKVDEFIPNSTHKWYGPSYQPRWWCPSFVPLRRNDFSYGAGDPASWPDNFEECGGQQQSPINIQTRYLKKRKTKKPLKWSQYHNVPKKMILENSLHSIHTNGMWRNTSSIPYITNGLLEKRYYFSQLHFHWGGADDRGSEHTVNNKSFPVEMHVVHDRLIEEPANLSEESNSHHLVVVAYMFEIVRNDNPALRPILNGIKEVRGNEKKKVYIKPFPLDDLLETFQSDYVSYRGSLTTPPCTEGVIWIINSKPLGISDRQVIPALLTLKIKSWTRLILSNIRARNFLESLCFISRIHKGKFETFIRNAGQNKEAFYAPEESTKAWRKQLKIKLTILRSSITDDSGKKIDNHRPVQKLNGRNVYYIQC